MNRRDFFEKSSLAAVGTAATVGGAMAPLRPVWARERADLTVTELGEHLFLVSGGGGNVTVFHPDEGVLLIDGGSMGASAEVLELIRKRTGRKRVHTLFNTHWHWDHTGSNLELGTAGTRIISHVNTKLWLSVDVDSQWENRKYKRLPAKALPNQTFYTPGSLMFGGATLSYALMPEAHTDGDIYVFFREANVLVGGDVVSVNAYPILDTASNGWITGNINGLTSLKGLCNDATKVIPGKGGAQAPAHLEKQKEMLTTVRLRMAKMLAQGKSAQEMIDAQPTKEFDTEWGNPELFIRNAFRGISLRPQQMGVNVV
ncbi:MAG TPA: MBL fold metallo-hydrolase [Steroidobacteraceae bacterium]|jgi:glyoxylase-like metal-dependent hydrolase (beta-lactamase superfamily II)